MPHAQTSQETAACGAAHTAQAADISSDSATLTSCVCPSSSATQSPLSVSHTRAVWSSEPDSNRCGSSGDHETPNTFLACPLSTRTKHSAASPTCQGRFIDWVSASACYGAYIDSLHQRNTCLPACNDALPLHVCRGHTTNSMHGYYKMVQT